MEFLSKTGNVVLSIALLVSCRGALLWAQEGDYQKGISYYKQQQYEKAIEEFEKIVEATPDYESGFKILGDSYLKVKDYEQAADAFKNALRLEKNNFASHYGLALAYYNSGKYTEALSALLESEDYAKSPRNQYALYSTRGSTYYNLHDFLGAVSDLEEATALQRGDWQNILQLGVSYYHVGDYPKAEQFLQQALALNPSDLVAPEYLGRLKYREGAAAIEAQDYPRAVELLSDYVSQNPTDGEARFNLGLAQLFVDNIRAAEDEFLRTAGLMATNWEVYDRLGYIYELKGDYLTSLKNYQKASDLNPNSAIEASIDRIQERIRRSK